MYTLHDMPVNNRPRERLIKKGADSLTDYELLAIILRTGSKESSVLELAKEMIITQGNIGYFNNISIEELKKYKGVKTAKAVEVLAAIEFGKRVCQFKQLKKTIENAADIFNYLRYDMANLDTEQVRVVYLNKRSEIIDIKIIALGTFDSTSIDFRQVIKWAIKLSCYSIIICHNHPSGNSEPSLQDKIITNELIALSHKMGVEFIDHIIIGKDNYYSFKENKKT